MNLSDFVTEVLSCLNTLVPEWPLVIVFVVVCGLAWVLVQRLLDDAFDVMR